MTCRIGDCTRPVKTRELCKAHYLRLCKYGDPEYYPRGKPSESKVCQVEECERPVRCKTRQLCKAHYERFYKYGDPEHYPRAKLPETCTHAGCHEPVRCSGYCTTHYSRWYQSNPARGIKRRSDYDDFSVRSYSSVHGRIRKLWGSARNYPCVVCGGTASTWAYDHTDPTQLDSVDGPYSRFPEFYLPACRSCHNRMDCARRQSERQTA